MSEVREYRTCLTVLEGADASAARAAIEALQAPPGDFTPATDAWPELRKQP